MPARVTAVQQSSDDIDEVEETGGPSPSSTSSAATSAPADPGPGSKLNPHAEARPPIKGTAYVNADPNAKDWTLYPTEALAKQKGIANVQSVATETAVYQNGQTATYILDGSGKRYADPASMGKNDQQRDIWDDLVKDDKNATGPATRRAVRAYPGVDKDGQPAIVTEYDKGDPFVRAMTAPERKSWESARESEWNANPANRVDANGNPDPSWSGRYEDHATRDARKDREEKEATTKAAALGNRRVNANDTTRLEKPDPANPGQWIDAGPNEAVVTSRAAADDAKKRQAAIDDRNTKTAEENSARLNAPKTEKDGNGKWGYWTRDTPPKWVPVDGPVAEQKPVPVNGVWGVWKPGKDGESPTFEPIKEQPGGIKLPDDAPKLDLTSGATAHTSYMALLSYVDQKVRSGEMTPEQGIAVLKIPDAQVKSVLGQEKDTLAQQNIAHDNQASDIRDQESQRNNRAQMSSNMFANASSRAGKPGELRGDLTPEYLQLQAQMNQASGAYRDPNVDIAAIGIGRAGAPGAAGQKPGMGVDGMPTDGNEKPDDILTVRDNQTGETHVLTRAAYNDQVANYPWVVSSTTVLDAKPASAPEGTMAGPGAPPAAPGRPLLGPPPAVPGSATVVPPAPEQAGGAGWSAPQDEGVAETPPSAAASAPSGASAGPVAAVGSYTGPTSMEARAQQMLQEGYSPEEVDEAMKRVLARYGSAAA